MQNLFARRRFAHVGKWRFSKPLFPGDTVNGIEIWNKISQRAKISGAYYIFSDELEMIEKAFPEIVELLPENCILCDMGIGSKEAITDKLGRVIRLSEKKIKGVIGVDILPQILDDAIVTFKQTFPHIRFMPLKGDMFKALDLPDQRHKIITVFGQTMFNPTVNPFDSGRVQRKIVDMLRGLRNHLRTDEKLLVSQNCSENVDEILNAYWEQQEVWGNIFHLMKRDLPITGNFDPEAFVFEPYWIPQSRILSHTAVPKTTMNFDLGRESVSVGPEDRFYMHNTLIYPVSEFEKFAHEASLKTFYQNTNSKKRMAFHFFESAM